MQHISPALLSRCPSHHVPKPFSTQMFMCSITCSIKGSTSHLLCGHDEHLITSQSLFQHRCSRVVSRVASKAAHLTCFVVTMNTSSRPKAFFNTDVHEWCHVQRQRQHLSPALWSRCTPHHVPRLPSQDRQRLYKCGWQPAS